MHSTTVILRPSNIRISKLTR